MTQMARGDPMSMELHAIPINDDENKDIFIIYRPLSGIAFVGNQALVDLAQDLAQVEQLQSIDQKHQPAYTFLEEIGFLEPDPPPPQTGNSDFQPITAVLLMTNQCQLRCTYCYAAAGELPAEYLTGEQGKAAIDYVFSSAHALGRPYFNLSFHGGGEPTMAWDVFKTCTAYARSKSMPVRTSLTSNGVWSRHQRAWILTNLDEVTISLDGRPQTQDRQRPFLSGSGSANTVFKTLEELDRHNFRYSIRMTATAPWKQLPEDVRYICEQTNCRIIQVEPAYNLIRGAHDAGGESDTNAFASAFMEAYEIATAGGRTLFYSGSRLGLVTDLFCRAPYDALIITPRGRLVSCYEVTDDAHPLSTMSTVGQYDGYEFSVNESARAGLHTLLTERQAGCRNCFCYRSCAGDCYTRAFDYEPGGHLVYGTRCRINRQIFQQLLLQGISQGNGVWRRPPSSGHQALPLNRESSVKIG